MAILGISEEKIKCRLCEDSATSWKVGSIEVDKGKVVSVRIFFLCDIHKDSENFEKPLEEPPKNPTGYYTIE